MSNTYCPLPWMHLYIGVTGQVQHCCVSEPIGYYPKESLERIWNSDHVKKVRLQLLNNEKPKACSDCFYKEDVLQSFSLRQTSLKEFGHLVNPEEITLPDGTCTEMKLHYIDFRFSNLCNFKCRMCDGIFSSSIATETLNIRKKTGNEKFGLTHVKVDYGQQMYEEFKKQYGNVKQIYFAGGEPIMQKEHFMVLSDLIEINKAKDIKLYYSTNGSKFVNSLGNMFDYWKHFKVVDVTFSIDAFGKQAEYWRHGGEWKDIENNMRECLKYPNIKNRMHSTIGWPNILNWLDFVRYAFDNKLFQDIYTSVGATPIHNPSCFKLSSIPTWKKEQISQKIHELIEYINNNTKIDIKENYLLNTIEAMDRALFAQDETMNKELFHEKITTIDYYRNESFFDVFPEHLDLKSYIYE